MASKRKILVADDEPYVTAILAAKLRQSGDEVYVASDGEEAFALATTHRPDLIITDYQMPLVSGFEMSIKLREDPRTHSVPVLMLTARGHQLSESQLARTNIKALFDKPFSAKELIAKADEVLGPREPIAFGAQTSSAKQPNPAAA